MEQDFFISLCVGPFFPNQGLLRDCLSASLCSQPLVMRHCVWLSRIVDDEMTLQCLEDDITVKIENRMSKGRNNNKPPNMEIRTFKSLHIYGVIYITSRIH